MFIFRRISFLFLLILANETFANEGRILFLSHPKSGTRWGLYCICTLTERSLDFRLGDRSYNLIKGAVPNDRPNGCVLAGHTPYTFGKIDTSSDKLILILRNYRESMLSWAHQFQRVVQNIDQEIKNSPMGRELDEVCASRRWGYFNNLQCYDLWNPEKRLLIYYEDFVSDPESVLAEVVDFLEIERGGEILEEFLQNFETHQDTLLSKAFRGNLRDNAKNKDLLQHSKRIGIGEAKKLDEKVKQSFPYLFDTYLSRFEIQGNQL